jgi:membrane-bound ClpP family serine protease
MTAIIILFTIGTLLLAAEVFLPGGIAGVIGGIALLGGSALAFREFGFTGGLAAVIAAVVLLGLMLYFELVVVPKTAVGKKMVVQSVIESTSQPLPAKLSDVLDKSAEALTTLSPSGYVLIDGQRYEAFCRSGHAVKGSTLRVVGVDTFRLIVTQS